MNVTPDSFSDGGSYLDAERAVARGLEMVAEGADVIDVGGESSRPGAEPVPEPEELRRVLPVVEAISETAKVSIDTRKEGVARAAVRAGASIVNDISSKLWRVAAEEGAAYVAMHMRGDPRTMQRDPRYRDVLGEVRAFLLEAARAAQHAGVEDVWIDPGIGFGKTTEHNLTLLRGLPDLVSSGYPVLVGTSRKSFLGQIARDPAGGPAPVRERFEASLATAVWAMLNGAAMVRVHDVLPTVQAAVLIGEVTPGPSGPVGDRTS